MAKVLISYSHRKYFSRGDDKVRLDQYILSTVGDVEQALAAGGHRTRRAGLSRNPTAFLKEFHRFRPNVIFNLCEEIGGDPKKEKSAAAFYDILGVPYTGNDTVALAVCLNKGFAKRLLKSYRLPTPPFALVDDAEDIELPFALPAIVKPVGEDGSLGISARSVVKREKDLPRRVAYVHKRFGRPALVEKFVSGREIQVSMMGTAEPRVLALAELSYKGLPSSLPKICTYSAKWHATSAYYKFTNPVLPARLNERTERRIREVSQRIFSLFMLRGYARIDFRVSRNHCFVIDINPNPDISPDAGFARAARWAGIEYPELVDTLVRMAME